MKRVRGYVGIIVDSIYIGVRSADNSVHTYG